MPHRWTYSSCRENTRHRDQQFHSCYASVMALECVDVRCRGKGPTFSLYYSVHPSWLLITSCLFNLTEIHHCTRLDTLSLAAEGHPADSHMPFDNLAERTICLSLVYKTLVVYANSFFVKIQIDCRLLEFLIYHTFGWVAFILLL